MKNKFQFTFYLRALQLIAFLTSVYVLIFKFDSRLIISAILFYVYLHIGVSVALHRYYSHKSFCVSKGTSYFFAFFGTLMMVGSPMIWALIHRQHHQYSDSEKDPHSFRHKGVFKILFGFWYDDLHISSRQGMDLIRDRSLLWAHQNYFKIIFCWIGFLFFLDKWALVYFYFIPVCAGILSLNINLILHHYLGYRHHDTKDQSRNNWYAFPFALGEAWHHNHHLNPHSPTTKINWWEFDPILILVRIFRSPASR